MRDIFGEKFAHIYRDPQNREELLVSEKILDFLRVYKSVRVKNDIFFSSDYMIDFNQWRVMAEKDMLVEHLADDFYYVDTIHSWPASPWQFFKDRHRDSWWLNWLVHRWPVEYQQTTETGQIKVKRYLGYPEAEIKSPRLGQAVPWETVEEVDTR